MRQIEMPKKAESSLEGALLIHKPFGYTSHDIVAIIRRLLRIRKVGHLGTLDPMATGLLPLLLGRATIFSNFLMPGKKRYIAWIHLGFSTNTYDIEGKKIDKPNGAVTDPKIVEEHLKAFKGKIMQRIPPYSAKKLNGKRLYKLAREGRLIQPGSKEVKIYHIEVLQNTEQMICLDIECTAGTYIRSFAHELGAKLGCGAYLSALIRIAHSFFSLKNALTLEEVEILIRKNEIKKCILPVDVILNNLPKLDIPAIYSATLYKEAQTGIKQFQFNAPAPSEKGYYRLLGEEGKLLAIISASEAAKNGQLFLKPEIIFR
jgi:tRNA pseudouridine55 synthase